MNTTDEIARLQAAAKRAQDGYHHEEAVDYYTRPWKSLQRGTIRPPRRCAMTCISAGAIVMNGSATDPAAMADFEAAARTG